jgi:leucyl/phenylalanyl-tRNA---protein transferase
MPIYRLTDQLVFPPVRLAEPEGLLAVGGDLSVERLLLAYRSGIFPWYEDGQPLLWWAPDPRFILFPERLKVSQSMRQVLNSGRFQATFDQAFGEVIAACAKIRRKGQGGTWITSEMRRAYVRLHKAGHAHSVEVWEGDRLAGGLYGVALGACFFGESMFARVSNASKCALIALVRTLRPRGLELIDCQVPTDHLASLGAEPIPRRQFMGLLRQALRATARSGWGSGRIVAALSP